MGSLCEELQPREPCESRCNGRSISQGLSASYVLTPWPSGRIAKLLSGVGLAQFLGIQMKPALSICGRLATDNGGAATCASCGPSIGALAPTRTRSHNSASTDVPIDANPRPSVLPADVRAPLDPRGEARARSTGERYRARSSVEAFRSTTSRAAVRRRDRWFPRVRAPA